MGLHVGGDVAIPLRDVVALLAVRNLAGRDERVNARLLEGARRKGRLLVVDSVRAHAFVVTRSGRVVVSPIRARRLAHRWSREWRRRTGP